MYHCVDNSLILYCKPFYLRLIIQYCIFNKRFCYILSVYLSCMALCNSLITCNRRSHRHDNFQSFQEKYVWKKCICKGFSQGGDERWKIFCQGVGLSAPPPPPLRPATVELN